MGLLSAVAVAAVAVTAAWDLHCEPHLMTEKGLGFLSQGESVVVGHRGLLAFGVQHGVAVAVAWVAQEVQR